MKTLQDVNQPLAPARAAGWRRSSLILLAGILVSASLACRLGGLAGHPALPTPTVTNTPVPVTTEAVEAMETQVSSAIATAQAGGPIVLEITEAQATSAAALALQQSGEQSVRNLQVHFQDGLMQITGDVNQSGFNLPLLVSIRFSVTAQGQPHAEIVSATVGPLPVPQSLLDQLTVQLDKIILDQFNSGNNQVTIESIAIQDGKMTVVATVTTP